VRRDCFKIPTGLYAIGNPDDKSPVIVSCNYKLTFDELRKNLNKLNLWLLIIDTKGINVWCAAGKGTFGTDEIIYRIKKMKIDKIVSHKNIILPQLGAPGVEAHLITKHTGFKVIYGPVRSEDISEFISSKYEATKEMRRVRFNFVDRLVLLPIEFMLAIKYIPLIYFIFLLLNINDFKEIGVSKLLQISMVNTIPYLIALLIGSVVVPLLLPIIPFRSLASKGVIGGLIWSFVVIKFNKIFLYTNTSIESIAHVLLLTSISAILSLNFTGSTTYTSYSGVQKEIIWAYPIAIVMSILGLSLLVINKTIF